MTEVSKEGGNTVRLSERRVFSASFKPLYDEGMALVEQTAQYLDGEGRRAAKGMPRASATLYAAESMRLTTRLMQIASWLLLQRAGNAGEMTRDQIESEKRKVRLDTPSALRDTAGWDEIPLEFRGLVDQSLRLQARVRQMDDEIYGAPVEPRGARRSKNPVSDQITLLNTAFGRG